MKLKAIFGGLLAAVALAGNVNAVPYLDVQFAQDNWQVQIQWTPKELPEPMFVWFLDNGSVMGGGGSAEFNGYIPSSLTGPVAPGEHIYSIRYTWGGEEFELFADPINIAIPTGERPLDVLPPEIILAKEAEAARLPDGGHTAILSLLAFGAVIVLSRLQRS